MNERYFWRYIAVRDYMSLKLEYIMNLVNHKYEDYVDNAVPHQPLAGRWPIVYVFLSGPAR